jgi:diguanylate cyclase (GGDEF)-like protein
LLQTLIELGSSHRSELVEAERLLVDQIVESLTRFTEDFAPAAETISPDRLPDRPALGESLRSGRHRPRHAAVTPTRVIGNTADLFDNSSTSLSTILYGRTPLRLLSDTFSQLAWTLGDKRGHRARHVAGRYNVASSAIVTPRAQVSRSRHNAVQMRSYTIKDKTGSLIAVLDIQRTSSSRDKASKKRIRDARRDIRTVIVGHPEGARLFQGDGYHGVVIDHLYEGVIIQTFSGVVLACNRAAQRILRETSTLVGSDAFAVMTPAYREDGSSMPREEWPFRRLAASGEAMLGVICGLRLRDGTTVWVRENLVPVSISGTGPNDAVLVSFTDVGPIREAHRNLIHQAMHDPLTGLVNRGYLLDRMSARIEDSVEAGKSHIRAAVLFIDLDGFKKVNDSAGHPVGDQLLREVARRLGNALPPADTLARVGGDEFVILVEAVTETASLLALGERLLRNLAEPFVFGDTEFHIGASMGISLYPEHGSDVATLLQNADAAMFDAKARGRNQCRLFEPMLREVIQRRVTIEQRLRDAVANGELTLHYQPIVETTSGRVVAMEALLRWANPLLGEVPPSEFVPIAEESGLIVSVGNWVLNRACEQAAEWRKALHADVRVAINLSPRQLTEDLPERLRDCLAKTGLEPDALELEITEGVLMEGDGVLWNTLFALSVLGVRICLDDFGTGYSSFSYLKRFPVQGLKIARSFVTGLSEGDDSLVIVKAMVAMAHALAIEVTAEGVEDEKQVHLLREIGCDRQQGYLLGSPLPADQCAAMIAISESRYHPLGAHQDKEIT